MATRMQGFIGTPGAPAKSKGNPWPSTPYDALPVGGGLTLGQLSNVDFTRFVMSRKIPGASHENGRERNAEAYSNFLDELKAAAADQAVAGWLGS
jgi:hypothetical protein